MSSKKAIITGITGQDGAYLAQLLLEVLDGQGHAVERQLRFRRGALAHNRSSGQRFGFAE